jgi:hypothetical protein
MITLIVLLMIAMKNFAQSFLGVAVVLLGLPVYYLILGKKQTQIKQSDSAFSANFYVRKKIVVAQAFA